MYISSFFCGEVWKTKASKLAKVRSHRQAVKTLQQLFVQDTAGKIVKAVSIPHARALPLAESVREAIEAASGFMDTSIFYTTPIISTHTGTGAIGFMYRVE